MLFTLISRLAPNFTNPNFNFSNLKFIYSEKATKFCEIFSYILTVCTVAFSEYVNFKVLQSFFFFNITSYIQGRGVPFLTRQEDQ